MFAFDLPSFLLGAFVTLVLVGVGRGLRRDLDPVRQGGDPIAPGRGGRAPVRPNTLMPSRPSGPPGPAGGGSTAARMAPPPSQQVVAALRTGSKIEAIRLYREQTGAGLAQAKEAVEALEARSARPGR